MRRFSLHPGVWVGSLGFIFGGVFAVLSASISQHALWNAGWISIGVGICVFIWGIKWDGEHWWKMLPRLRSPRFWCGRMYVGQILVFDSQLDDLHTLSMTVRGYNGTGRDRVFLGASGTVKLGYVLNGTGPEGVNMAPPGLVDPPSRIAADSEFHINFQQPLTPEQAASFRQWETQGADIQLMFDGLSIMTKPARFGSPERLGLWDGISLRNGRFFGRIVCVTGHAGSRGSATLGGR